MRLRSLATGTVAVLALALAAGPWTHAAEQEKPNFSGVWSRIPETVQGRPAERRVLQHWAAGQPVTFTQDEATLTIAYVGNGRNHNRVRLAYDLRGAKTPNMSPSGPWPAFLPPAKFTSWTHWDGVTLVLNSLREYATETGATVTEEVRERLTMESTTTFRLDSSSSNYAPATARFQRATAASR